MCAEERQVFSVITWRDVEVEKARREAQIAEAARYREGQNLTRPRGSKMTTRIALALADRLIEWGTRLKRRYPSPLLETHSGQARAARTPCTS